jgi:hypothetical protein
MQTGLDNKAESDISFDTVGAPGENGYFSSVLNLHLFNTNLGDGEIRLLLALHSYCKIKNLNTRSCQTFVSIGRLAENLHCSEREVKRRLRELEAAHAIHTTVRSGHSNVYTLLPPHPTSSAQNDPVKSDSLRIEEKKADR